MTGFAGVIEAEGAGVDPSLADAVARAIAPIGPDRQDRWGEGRAFLAHALLASTESEVGDRQPLSFDGDVHLIADARIDGRAELVRKLRDAGRTIGDDTPDSALILHAWYVWGTDCATHLIGDFAFAIWDAPRRQLFCARDQFGMVPFYFARVGEALIFGNALAGVLAHPGLDRSLNKAAVGDYLLFGLSRDPQRGFYANVEWLPPAHALLFRDGAVRSWRYWQVAEVEPDRQASPDEWAERFDAALSESVADRLRFGNVAATLSGGMDSTLVTSMALRNMPAGGKLAAWTFGCDWLAPDTERHWARRCAHHIGVPFQSFSLEDSLYGPDALGWRLPWEPRFDLRASALPLLAKRALDSGARVLMMGMGGDAITNAGRLHWAKLIRAGQYGRLIGEAMSFSRYHGKRPPLRGAWKFREINRTRPHRVPLNPAFAAEYRLEERWADQTGPNWMDPRIRMANEPFWTQMFVAMHPETSGLAIRVRQPFFDVRLVELAMRLPPAPLQFQKALLRRVGRGLLPPEVVRRPKTPLGDNPMLYAAKIGLEPWIESIADIPELEEYIDRDQLRRNVKNLGNISASQYARAIAVPGCLGTWLSRKYVS